MKRYGLLGRTLKHSFSKNYFTQKFASAGIFDCEYLNFELPSIESFPKLLESHPELVGLNVTIPYKEDVLPFLTAFSDVVEQIGACNCIKIDGEKVKGYNTDVVGFRNSLSPRLESHHQKALVLGTGGASKAIQYVLEQLGIGYKTVSRQRSGERLAYEDVDEKLLTDHYLIINTTPLGMFPNTDAAPVLPYQALTPRHLLFDIVYNPEKTRFLAEGEKRGAQICNGYEMLIGQAEESWRIWNSFD